jgi:hypothetical protein
VVPAGKTAELAAPIVETTLRAGRHEDRVTRASPFTPAEMLARLSGLDRTSRNSNRDPIDVVRDCAGFLRGLVDRAVAA